MSKGITIEALSTWKSLVAMKQEAIGKLMKKIPGAKLVETEVKRIDIGPSDTEKDVEECEIFLSLNLSFALVNVTIKQIVELMSTGDVRLIDRSKKSKKWYIEYITTYRFESDEEAGEDLFCQIM